MNDSSTGGYLLPEGAAPEEDAELEGIFQKLIVGLTGLQGSLVRRRWQEVVPIQPPATTNWCAIGVTSIKRDANPSIIYPENTVTAGDTPVTVIDKNGSVAALTTGDITATYQRHVEIHVLASFYGPSSMGYAELTADSVRIPQNLEAIKSFGMGFVGVGEIIPAPELVNQGWIRRHDLPMHFRREVVRTYPILNLLSAQAATESDS